MSLEVSDGICVSTYSGRAATEAGPFHAFDLWGERVEAQRWHSPLHEATDEIYALSHAPDRLDHEVVEHLSAFVKNLNLVLDTETGVEAFQPSSRSEASFQKSLQVASQAGNGAEPLIFLSNPMPQEGLVNLVGYVMLNTGLWAEDLHGQRDQDPRIGMIEQFRSVA